MFNMNVNGNKSFSLANIIEEQLSNITLVGSTVNLEHDNNELTLDECPSLESASSPRRNSAIIVKEEKPIPREADVNKIIDVLAISEVRWFYKEVDKSTKIWTPFGGYDTLNIENAFRSSPLEVQNHVKKGSLKTDNLSAVIEENIQESSSQSRQGKVLVLGNLYEVDLGSRTCTSVYWPGEIYIVTRGTWFYDTWQPLDEDYCRLIEPVHLSLFKGKKCIDFSGDSTCKAFHSEPFSEFNVDWYSPQEVYLYSQGTPSKIVRSFTQKLGYFQKSAGSKIYRGYKEVATDADKPQDISHLVFVVHGIGQKMNIGAQIFRNTSLIRDRVSSLKNKFFSDCPKRVEFFPVEWRSNLVLDGGTVDSITPPHVKYLRQVLNTSAMDIMYYTSPIYMAEIQDGLVTEMNRLYTMFRERNPTFVPKVSVIAHSLGAVITYDVVTGWLPTGMSNDGVIIPGKSRLNFEIDNFFCLGSPLSVFLALRVPKGQHGYHLFPPTLCNRLYNIFHLTDPVAYRLEPLIHRDYARISPLAIHSYTAVRPVPYSDMPLELIPPEVIVSSSCNAPDIEPSTSPAETPNKEKGWSLWNTFIRGHNKSQDSGSPHHTDSPTQGLEHRLDYVLTAGTSGPLIVRSVLVSHTAYWSSLDVAYFVLTRIFPELETATPCDDRSPLVSAKV